jgi:hypothetical protein
MIGLSVGRRERGVSDGELQLAVGTSGSGARRMSRRRVNVVGLPPGRQWSARAGRSGRSLPGLLVIRGKPLTRPGRALAGGAIAVREGSSESQGDTRCIEPAIAACREASRLTDAQLRREWREFKRRRGEGLKP